LYFNSSLLLIYVSIYLCMYVCMYVHIYVYMYMHVHVYMYMYVYTFVRVYVYIWWPVQGTPVSSDKVSPLKLSPLGDSISIQILLPEDLFQNRFSPGDYILKQSLRGRDIISSPSK